MADKKSRAFREVEEDHAGIRQHIGELREVLMREVRPEKFSDWRLEFMWQLRDFKNRLLKHFDLEEEGGFMREVLEAAPHTSREVQELKDEHQSLIRRLDEFLAVLKAMEHKDPEKLQTLRIELDDMVSQLRRHENREHILMQKAYYREYGGDD